MVSGIPHFQKPPYDLISGCQVDEVVWHHKSHTQSVCLLCHLHSMIGSVNSMCIWFHWFDLRAHGLVWWFCVYPHFLNFADNLSGTPQLTHLTPDPRYHLWLIHVDTCDIWMNWCINHWVSRRRRKHLRTQMTSSVRSDTIWRCDLSAPSFGARGSEVQNQRHGSYLPASDNSHTWATGQELLQWLWETSLWFGLRHST